MDPQNWLSNYGDGLYNYALARLGEHHAAEEVVQETLLDAVRAMDTFEGRSTEKTWLFSILKYKITDFVRSQWRQHRPMALSDEVDPARSLFDKQGNWQGDPFESCVNSLESSDLWKLVQQCLHRLPKKQAQVFMLSVLEEKNCEEICNELNISTTNFSVRLHRARLGLAKCVSERWPLKGVNDKV